MFLKGQIKEIDIPGTSLYSIDEMWKTKILHVGSVIIASNKTHEHRVAAVRFLLAQFITLIKSFTRPDNIQYVYAIAATEEGQDLLNLLSFDVDSKAEERIDKHNLYRAYLHVMAKKIIRILKHANPEYMEEIDRLTKGLYLL